MRFLYLLSSSFLMARTTSAILLDVAILKNYLFVRAHNRQVVFESFILDRALRYV